MNNYIRRTLAKGGRLKARNGEEENEEYYPIWLDGITVKPSGNRPTTRDDWSWANWRELQNEREQKSAESVRGAIDLTSTRNFVKDNSGFINNVLDFVPVVGGINRLAQGNYAHGIINLGLDAVAPVKYLAKGAKGLKELASIANVAKNSRRYKLYERAADRYFTKTKDIYESGSKDLFNKTFDVYKGLRNKQYSYFDKLDKGKKLISRWLFPKTLYNSTIGYISDNTRLKKQIAEAAHHAGVSKSPIEAVRNMLDLRYYKDYPPRLDYDPGISYLLNDKEQEEFMNNLGYFKTTDEDGIKMIKKATDALTRFRLGRRPNIYQIGEDVVPRDSIYPIPIDSLPSGQLESSTNYYLMHAGNYPTIYYKHKNKDEYYYRDIDLNDYGNHGNTAGTTYGLNQIFGDIYDFIGNPFIQKTGIQQLKFNDIKRNGGRISLETL